MGRSRSGTNPGPVLGVLLCIRIKSTIQLVLLFDFHSCFSFLHVVVYSLLVPCSELQKKNPNV